LAQQAVQGICEVLANLKAGKVKGRIVIDFA
jgi:D-arabinose 1-dehydrogenase-like Zn-dependent alcohol dehydrogenase